MQLLFIAMTTDAARANLLLPMVEKAKKANMVVTDDVEVPANPEFGRLLTKLMDQMQLSMPEVARKMGVSPEMVRRYRSGTTMPRKDKMKILATLLGVKPTDLYDPGGDPASVPPIGGPLIVDDPEEMQLLEAYRALDATPRKVLRHRATELLEQFGKPSKKNPYGQGN